MSLLVYIVVGIQPLKPLISKTNCIISTVVSDQFTKAFYYPLTDSITILRDLQRFSEILRIPERFGGSSSKLNLRIRSVSLGAAKFLAADILETFQRERRRGCATVAGRGFLWL